jgi:hypothetical protein
MGQAVALPGGGRSHHGVDLSPELLATGVRQCLERDGPIEAVVGSAQAVSRQEVVEVRIVWLRLGLIRVEPGQRPEDRLIRRGAAAKGILTARGVCTAGGVCRRRTLTRYHWHDRMGGVVQLAGA